MQKMIRNIIMNRVILNILSTIIIIFFYHDFFYFIMLNESGYREIIESLNIVFKSV